MKRILQLFVFASIFSTGLAQTTLDLPRNVMKAYTKNTRNMSGAPGDRYWQNSANYDIKVSFDPSNRMVRGSEDIVYTNNSPDTLKRLVFKLFPNIYSKGVPRVMRLDSSDLVPPVKIRNLKVNDSDCKPMISGTIMYVYAKQILPSQKVNISMDFNFILNKGSVLRGGQSDEGAWFVPYFFPRVSVYDDIDGWDTYRYLGLAEFYNDFCNFKLSVTVPEKYVVWATGTLMNPSDVYDPTIADRVTKAEKSDDIITIIDNSDIEAGNLTAKHPLNTFKFEAENVTDVAFAISNHYLWKSSSVLVDSSSGRRTRVDAVYSPVVKDFNEVVDFAGKTVKLMSYYFPRWPYPYQHETVFNCRTMPGGMEFPMMVNDGNYTFRILTIDVTLHEVFHTMFPFFTGLNETKYGWMDEGMAMLSNLLLLPKIDSGKISPTFSMSLPSYIKVAGNENDLPVYTISDQQVEDASYENNLYTKPALAFYYLRDLTGEELFLKGLHQFITEWHGRHPIPNDFFNCMNSGIGQNLNWYWNEWFYKRGYPDLAISGFKADRKSGTITIEKKGQKPVPIDLTVKFVDGSKQTIHRSVAVWEKGAQYVELKVPVKSAVKEIVLGSALIPDVNNKDNKLIVTK